MPASNLRRCFADSGQVYVWGGGSEGQLGLGAAEMEVPTPTLLDVDERVTCLSCGYYHTALVTGTHRTMASVLAVPHNLSGT